MAPTPSFGAPLEKLRQEFDSLMETAWTNWERAQDRFGFRAADTAFEPEVGLVETDEHVIVSVDVPGIEPANVNVSLVGNMLTLKGERLPGELAEGVKRHLSELRSGKFSRSIPLPVAVDPDRVSAAAKNGVLTIHLAKQSIDKPRQIHVNVS